MSTFYGESIAQFPDQVSYDPRTGVTVRRPWRGTPDAIASKMTELSAEGTKFDHDPGTSGGYEWITAFYSNAAIAPASVPISDIWSMPGNDLEKDLWLHPKVTAEFAADLSGGFPTQAYFTKKKEIEEIVDGTLALDDSTIWAGASDNLKKFIRALARGVVGYPVSQYVVRNTKVVAKGYGSFVDAAIPAYTYVGKILTTSDLQNGFGVPGEISFVMPGGYWLQRTPTVLPDNSTTSQQWVITQEWWHTDEYDDFVYDPIT